MSEGGEKAGGGLYCLFTQRFIKGVSGAFMKVLDTRLEKGVAAVVEALSSG